MGVVFTFNEKKAIQMACEDHKEQKLREERDHRERLVKIQRNTRLVVELAGKLPDGCELCVSNLYELLEPTVVVERDALPFLRRAVGKLSVYQKRLVNAKERRVRITLRTEAYPGFDFEYERELPPDSNGRCQIRTSVSEYSTLVCTI